MEPTLNQLTEWAKNAGDILREGYGREHTVHRKGRFDLVTEIDRRSEAYLIGQIRDVFPNDTIVAEESGHLHGANEHCWYLDPLDGTTNYAHGLPFFSVSIGYSRGGELALGVVYDPMRDECFNAERGRGAWLNGCPIAVSDIAELENSLLVTGFPYDLWETEQDNMAHFRYFGRRTQGVRRLGSAALDMCYVASGRLEAHWEFHLKSWDVAAGALIVREAGGVVTDPDGDADIMKPPFGVLSANPALHARLLAGIRAVRDGAD